MFMRLNNILLGLFLLIGLIDALFFIRPFSLKSIFSRGWPVMVFFLLAILATVQDFDSSSFKYLEKYLSFILVPMAMLNDREEFDRRRTTIFKSLVWGCLATLIICYGSVAYHMIANGEPFEYIFRWKYMGHQFTAVAESHPTYLGIFIVTSILFLIQDTSIGRNIKWPMYLLLVIGLFQLASRTALLLLVIFVLFLVINKIKTYKVQLLALIIGIVGSVALLVTVGSKYMEDRIFSLEAVTDSNRIERWEVSYEIFRENPLTGVGYKRVKELRKDKYEERDLPISAATEYNAHNQLLEYLSTNGAIGGFIYVISLSYLVLMSMLRRDNLYIFIFLIFILANCTESMMVRIKGIEFFAIFTTLFLCSRLSRPKENEYLYHA